MCCETWPLTMFPKPQLKAHYGPGPWVLVRHSECCRATAPPGTAAGLSLWRHVCQRGTRNIKCSAVCIDPALSICHAGGRLKKPKQRWKISHRCLLDVSRSRRFTTLIKSHFLLLLWTNVTKTETKDIFVNIIFTLKVNKCKCFLTV